MRRREWESDGMAMTGLFGSDRNIWGRVGLERNEINKKAWMGKKRIAKDWMEKK